MRFLADMGIARDVLAALRALGHEADHLSELGLHRLPDDGILQKAGTETRIILAHDLDFGRLLALSGASGPSVITFRLADMRPQNVEKRLLDVLDSYESELEQGAAITVTDGNVRCRTLPILSPK